MPFPSWVSTYVLNIKGKKYQLPYKCMFWINIRTTETKNYVISMNDSVSF